MKITVEGTSKEVKELLQAIESSKEQHDQYKNLEAKVDNLETKMTNLESK